MYGLTKGWRFNKRGLGGYGLAMLAALILLSIMPVQTQAQSRSANVYTGTTQIYEGVLNVGSARKKTLRIRIANTNNRGKCCTSSSDDVIVDGRVITGYVQVFNAAGQRLAFSDEIQVAAGEVRSFGIGSDVLVGGRTADLLLIRVEVLLVAPSTRQGEEPIVITPPTFKLIDEKSGKTVLTGHLTPAVPTGRDKVSN